MKLDHYFFHAGKSSENQKKGLHRKLKSFNPRNQVKTNINKKKRSSLQIQEFLSSKSSEDQKNLQRLSSAQMQTRVKLLGEGIQSNYSGGYIPPFPQGFGTPVTQSPSQSVMP